MDGFKHSRYVLQFNGIHIYICHYSPTSRKIDVSGGIFFNNREQPNDLDGTLSANVVFAQASTFPSRPATDSADIRPHLVALRDTLVLFKPLDEAFDSTIGAKMSVFDQDDNLDFDQSMLPPDQLPAIADRIGDIGDEFLFLEPDSYDIIVDGIAEFNDNVDLILKNNAMIQTKDGLRMLLFQTLLKSQLI